MKIRIRPTNILPWLLSIVLTAEKQFITLSLLQLPDADGHKPTNQRHVPTPLMKVRASEWRGSPRAESKRRNSDQNFHANVHNNLECADHVFRRRAQFEEARIEEASSSLGELTP
jgi:hypothetical protein